MAKSKAKEPKAPLKGEKKKDAPKASATARVKPSQLSEEKILESGSESDSGSSGGHSDTESEDEKRKNTKKPNVKKAAATEPSEPAVPDDTSDEDESSESSEEGADTAGSKVASKRASKDSAKANGTKRKADESSSGESEESDNDLPDAPAAKKARSESSSSEEESEEDSEQKGQADKMDVDKPALPPGVVASSLPVQPFEPPSGYVPMDTKSRSAFQSSDLKGKQIWHITAPIDLPISSLHEVALDAVQSGKPVLSHKGRDYVMSEDKGQQESETALLLPSKDGYTPVQQPIARTLHLKQHVVLPNLSEKQADQTTGSNTAGDAATAAVTAVRPQPRGLKMRYRPPGFGAGNPGTIGSESESEDGDALPVGKEKVFQFPKKPEVSGKKEKKDKKEKKSKKKP